MRIIKHFRARWSCVRSTRIPFIFLAALSIAGLVALPSSSGAQDLRKFEPLPVPPQVEAPGGALKPPPVPDQPGQDERVLVDALRGLVFIDRSDAAVPKVQMPPDGIDVRRLPRLQTPDFRKLVEPYLGRPVSRAVLNRLVGGIHAYYNKRDMPFVSVTLPEQDITTGVVQVLVVEGTLGRLRVEGTKWFSEKQYLSAIRMRPGDPIRLSVLNEDIAWINRNPFRQADVFFDQGETVGGTNLVLRTKERLPLRAYIGYNNNGSESTDRNQFLAGFNWGNAFGLGHLLSYQYMTSPDLQQLRGHSLSYMIPLPWRDTLTISGTYSEIKPDMPTPFRRDGMSAQAVLRYDVDLKPLGPLKHALGVLFEYKVTDNNLLFGGIPVTDNRTEIMQLSGVYAGEIADPWGFNTFSLRLTESPGGLSSRNKTQYFEASRAFASADYFYGALDLSRRQKLPFDFALVLSGRLQLADGNLLGSEQLSLGGANSVRGFDEGIIYGDRGYIMHAELHAPVIPLHQWLPLGSTPLLLQLLGFYDHGAVGNVDRLPKEDRQYTLKSAGLGLRFAVSRHAAINFDYGWRLMEFPGIDYNSRGHLSITLSY